MKAATCITMLLTLALLAGCVPGEKKAAELLETARFEEKQSNLEHATKLYDEILKKYPSSPAAIEAAARMSEIRQQKP
jgi:TolA-binding protein